MLREIRAARLAVSLGLGAAAPASVAGTIALVVCAVPSTALAQKQVATQKLIDQGKEKFDDQQYDESIQKLSAALLRQDTTQAQKIEVYRWLAYNYIVLKQDDSARTALFALYALDEDYTLPKTESPKFRDPFEKYRQQWIDDGRPGKKSTEKAASPVVLKHLPGAEVPHDQSVAISGSIEDADKRVAKISIFYRTGSSGKFTELPATIAKEEGQQVFRANIPGSAVKPPIVEYYVQANDKGGLAIGTRGDAETPLRLVVQAEKESSILGSWWFWTGATAVVAGGVIGAFFLTRKKDNGPGTTGPIGPGNSSITITISE